MRLVIALLALLGILWTAGMYWGLHYRDAHYEHDPDLIVEVPYWDARDEWLQFPERPKSNEQLQQIEQQTAKEVFSRETRNPMERVK